MLREMDLQTQTDGKKYSVNDMVRVGCNDCEGCSECCRVVADTILLDPYDVFRLMKGTQLTMQQLMERYIELGMANGVILPHMKIDEKGGCAFLNERGRCSVHDYRSGFCRLYPLGRLYENGDYSYILLTDQCDKGRTKVKIKKWLDTPEYEKYHGFIISWHDLLKEYQERFSLNPEDEQMKQTVMSLLTIFYMTPYDLNADFYEQYEERIQGFRNQV